MAANSKKKQSTQSTVKEEEEKIQSHPAAAIPLVPGSETLPEDIVSLYQVSVSAKTENALLFMQSDPDTVL